MRCEFIDFPLTLRAQRESRGGGFSVSTSPAERLPGCNPTAAKAVTPVRQGKAVHVAIECRCLDLGSSSDSSTYQLCDIEKVAKPL